MSRSYCDTIERRSVGRPSLTAAIAAAQAAQRREAQPLAGVQGHQPLPSWLSGASGPRERHASGQAREGRKARGARSIATRAPCTPKRRPANNLRNGTIDTRSDRGWTRAGHPLGRFNCQSRPGITDLRRGFARPIDPDFSLPHNQRASGRGLHRGEVSRARCAVWISYPFPLLTMSKDQEKNKPAQQYRLRGLAVSVFANTAKDRSTPFYKVSMQKTYKDGDEFKTTTSLGRDDLPVADLLLRQAWVWILEREAKDRKEANEDEE